MDQSWSSRTGPSRAASCKLRRVSVQIRRRTAALLEVFGVYLTGAFLSDQIGGLLVRWGVVSPQNPFDLLTTHTNDADLLVASRLLLVRLVIQYGSYLALIIPVNWWYRRRGLETALIGTLIIGAAAGGAGGRARNQATAMDARYPNRKSDKARAEW